MAIMNRDRSHWVAGVSSDLAFSFGTYLVLATILGILTLLFSPELEPIVGGLVAKSWGYFLALSYCSWQFWTFRRLRHAEQSLNSSTSATTDPSALEMGSEL